MAKCLFLINGLGMGNSTRCYAIIQHLHRMGVEVHVMTSNNGLKFFEQTPEVKSLHQMLPLEYGKKDGRLSVWRTFASLSKIVRALYNKNRQLRRALDTIQPDVVVTDSEYFVVPVVRRRIPLIGINNADVVVTQYRQRQAKPASIRAQFWLIEHMDYWIHRLFWTRVLSPAIVPDQSRGKNYQQIGIIVREEILAANQAYTDLHQDNAIKRIVIMLSGSGFGTNLNLEQWNHGCHIDVVGREGHSTEKVTYHGKLINNIDLLLGADVLVVNGGFSAVSEALVLCKPTLVIPIPNHAEQWLNAIQVQDYQRGILVEEHQAFVQIQTLCQAQHMTGFSPDQLTVDGHGAEQAAEVIMTYINGQKP